MIAEVLSKSTQDYDRGEKFVAYRTIDSFCEYLLINQYSIHIEHYIKTAAHQWLLSEYEDPKRYLLVLLIFKFKLLKFMKASILMLEIMMFTENYSREQKSELKAS